MGRVSVKHTQSWTMLISTWCSWYFMGGRTPTNSDEIDYINVASTGNSTDFGNLLATASRGFANGQTSSSVRGLAMGGQSTLDDIQSITIASTGNATMHSGLLTVDKDCMLVPQVQQEQLQQEE